MSPRPSRARAAETTPLQKPACVPSRAPASVVACIACAALASCATPAVDVKVPTSSMDDAYRASIGAGAAGAAVPARGTARIVETTIRPDRPAPIVAAPDIRLAFFYQWVDAEGNLHYPSWVAIPVETFRWVVPALAPTDGTLPLDGSRSQPAPADPLPRNRHGSESRPGQR